MPPTTYGNFADQVHTSKVPSTVKRSPRHFWDLPKGTTIYSPFGKGYTTTATTGMNLPVMDTFL